VIGDPVKLRVVLGDYPHVLPLKRGDVASPRLSFDFVDIKPPNRAFKPMVRDLEFDVCEMAIVTYLQAKAQGKPLLLLPAVMLGRLQHGLIVYNRARGALRPADLAGKRIGVRMYAQTTAAWLRGILAHEHGVDLERLTWVTFEGAHVAEYRDPANVERVAADKNLLAMLLAGEIDAAIGEFAPDKRIAPLIAEPEKAALDWHARHRAVHVNHLVVVKEATARSHPWVPGEVYRLLAESKRRGAAAGPIDMLPFGIEANRRALELIIAYSAEQELIPRRFAIDELFDASLRSIA
jgi:4,5-dihydroxyphthalate decarboxylase